MLDDQEAIAQAKILGEAHVRLWRVSEAGDELIHNSASDPA